MRTILFYDTETTGLPLFSEPSEDPRQPHIVQLAAKLVDSDTRKTIASIDLIARPDGWTIPDDVADIHGITTQHALAVGVPERLIVEALLHLYECKGGQPVTRCGHNESFDARMVRIAMMRFGLAGPDEWKVGASWCTALMSTPIMKLPPTERMVATGRKGPKMPKLSEAYKFFTGKELENAHSALADVDACAAVHWAIQDRFPVTDGGFAKCSI